MSNNSRSPSRSDTRRTRSLKAGAAFGLTYLLLLLILSRLPMPDSILGSLLLSGPGFLVVLVLPLPSASLVAPVLYGATALFYFTVGATTAYAAKFRWLILAIWAIIAIASAILGLFLTIVGLAEPIP